MRVRLWSVLTVAIGMVSGVGRAHAEDRSTTRAKPVEVQAEILRTAQTKLESGDEAAVRQALTSLGELGGEAAAQSVVARLRRGLPPQLIEAAIDTLVLLNRPGAAAPLLELAQHRRIPIRVRAMQALAALRLTSAQSALLYALDDPSSEVRGAAVEALAVVGTTRALPALLTAAERDVPGAWRAVGKVATPADVKKLLERAPQGDLTVIRPALDAMLARSSFALAAKRRLIDQVRAVASPSARVCLADWLATHDAAGDARLRRTLLDGVARFDRDNPGLAHAQAAGPGRAGRAALASSGEVR